MLLTLPVVLLVVAGIVVLVAAATSDSDAGGYAVLFALAFVGPALIASPVPILGWVLRRRHPRGSAVVVLLGGAVVCFVALGPVLGVVLGSSPWVSALPGVLGLALGATTVAAGVRTLRLLRPTG